MHLMTPCNKKMERGWAPRTRGGVPDVGALLVGRMTNVRAAVVRFALFMLAKWSPCAGGSMNRMRKQLKALWLRPFLILPKFLSRLMSCLALAWGSLGSEQKRQTSKGHRDGISGCRRKSLLSEVPKSTSCVSPGAVRSQKRASSRPDVSERGVFLCHCGSPRSQRARSGLRPEVGCSWARCGREGTALGRRHVARARRAARLAEAPHRWGEGGDGL